MCDVCGTALQWGLLGARVGQGRTVRAQRPFMAVCGALMGRDGAGGEPAVLFFASQRY